MYSLFVTSIGLLAQGCFSARILIQWIKTERAKRILSPDSFWIFSLLGSILLFLYGWLRCDFSIICGQFLTYWIYIWNLRVKGLWQRYPALLRYVVVGLPLAALANVSMNAVEFFLTFLSGENVALWLMVYGTLGQVVFTLRFLYQWLYSRKRNESMLPIGFWIISLIGSLLIVSYGLMRLDVVLILGQGVGLLSYIRNIQIGLKSK